LRIWEVKSTHQFRFVYSFISDHTRMRGIALAGIYIYVKQLYAYVKENSISFTRDSASLDLTESSVSGTHEHEDSASVGLAESSASGTHEHEDSASIDSAKISVSTNHSVFMLRKAKTFCPRRHGQPLYILRYCSIS